MEETFGFVDGPIGSTEKEIEQAIDQHLRIVLQCVALSEQFDDLEYCGRLHSETVAIWRQMRALYDAILEHEALERQLIGKSWGLPSTETPPILPQTPIKATPQFPAKR
jgi:hypothetical protein